MSASPFQGLAAGAGILFLFLAVSRTTDFIGVSGIALFVGLVGLISTGLTGGIARALTSKIGLSLIAFSAWLCVCVPFSVWMGGSVGLLKETWSRSFMAFVIIGGSLVTITQLKKAMYTAALAAMAISVFALKFASAESGRLAFNQGTLANPNDLAAYLLMTVPLCFFVFIESKTVVVKVGAVLMILVLLAMTLRTGSRSGLVTIGILALYLFWSASVPKKILMTLAAMGVVVTAPLYLPESVMARFRSLVSNESQTVSSNLEDSQDRQADFAEGSTQSRSYLLRKSIEITITHPVFGVGPGMFAVAVSDLAKAEGDRALWQQTHNTYTQVSSETGLPGLLMFLCWIFCIFRATRMPLSRNTSDPEIQLLSNVAFALRMALISFCGGALFGSLAYGMQLPILGGLAETLRRVIESRRHQTQVVPVPQIRVSARLPLRPALR
jgi:O-antigen ligase